MLSTSQQQRLAPLHPASLSARCSLRSGLVSTMHSAWLAVVQAEGAAGSQAASSSGRPSAGADLTEGPRVGDILQPFLPAGGQDVMLCAQGEVSLHPAATHPRMHSRHVAAAHTRIIPVGPCGVM